MFSNNLLQISSELTSTEICDVQQKLYEYFKSGYHFELFLKEYLTKIGLDEVEVTAKGKDGGIDLKAIRKGIGNFSDTDTTHYFIQAKKYMPKNKISVKILRELRGVIPPGLKGILITTSTFTPDCIAESDNSLLTPIILIDGKNLVTSCIDNGIGFIYKPVFSTDRMNHFIKSNIINKTENVISTDFVEKLITNNDIRARIISIPSSIMNKLDENADKVDVIVNKNKAYNLTINRDRNYFGGVTALLREHGMIQNDGVITPRMAQWQYDKSSNKVMMHINKIENGTSKYCKL